MLKASELPELFGIIGYDTKESTEYRRQIARHTGYSAHYVGLLWQGHRKISAKAEAALREAAAELPRPRSKGHILGQGYRAEAMGFFPTASLAELDVLASWLAGHGPGVSRLKLAKIRLPKGSVAEVMAEAESIAAWLDGDSCQPSVA